MGDTPIPSDPQLRRWMLFVDGENLTIRAQSFAERQGFSLQQGAYHMPDVYIWFPEMRARETLRPPHERLQPTALRAYYYTSVQGGEQKVKEVREALWSLGFNPSVFWKPSNMRTKGVDITLTLDVVTHAFFDHYDVAFLIAGDGDYIPLVERVKRLGKGVVVGFFTGEGSGLNPELRLASDTFFPLDDLFLKRWKK